MSGAAGRPYDVAIVGAGPVGSLCALAHARKGARVALFEANPRGAGRLAGEWLHPPAVRILREVGIDIDALPHSIPGNGFAVFPEDGSEPILLPYPDGSRGLACDHALLVSSLREAIEKEADVDFISHARVKAVDDGRVAFSVSGDERTVTAARIVGADGRASIVRQSLGLSTDPILCSRMLGVTIGEAGLPFEGYGHVVLGGPGPILIYGLAGGCVRVIVDLPLDRWTPRDRIAFLSESCAGLLPGALGPAFVEALRAGQFDAAANQLRPRVTYGSPRRVLIGDAAGHYHPMTAVGMTLGFGDALALAGSRDFRDFTAERFRETRIPEFLAMGLYEVFADHRVESMALRSAIYRSWRANSAYRDRTTRILACEDRTVTRMSLAFCRTVVGALAGEVSLSFRQYALHRARTVFHALAVRLWWLVDGARQLRRARREGREEDRQARRSLARAFLYSMPSGSKPSRPARSREVESPDAGPALKSAAARLLSLQREDGAWEGEMVWCPMLTAQYALLHHIVGRPLEPGRRRRVLRSFDRTRLEGGAWGLH
ncbi:MAG: FAD-dependent monooxygenase, partial [Alphaproteobacteria bacterium]|nr:FAD-dependent monooxygenase [Alphaproteobacteria bacterium]